MVELNVLNNQQVVLAVSGGIDSMVMLDIFCRNYGEKFSVATIDHCMRKQSASDCLFVKNYCQQRNIECEIIKLDVPTFCQENKLSDETGARLLRHAALRQYANGRIICLAHNANDQAETVLMHILRGSGVDGACAMTVFDGKYFRPLLAITREQIEQYAKQNNISYVTDCTNFDTTYTRNYLRKEVFPLLSRINSQAVTNICRFASLAQADKSIFDGILEVVFAKNPPEYFADTATFSTEICTLAQPIASRAIFAIFDKLGYTYDIEAKHIEDIIALAGKNVGKKVSLPFGLIAVRDYQTIVICPDNGEMSYVDSVTFGVGSCTVADQTVEVSKTGAGLQFDITKIPTTAVFRTRREGDVFTKFGGGTKKLKDYLIDKKIPQRIRDSLVIVADGKNVLIIVGVEISDSVRCEENSDIYKIRIIQGDKQ